MLSQRDRPAQDQGRKRYVSRPLQRLETLAAILVTSAGNDGSREGDLSSKPPTYFGTDDNVLITVGGVETDGDLWPLTTPKKPGKPGSMTTYALAKGFWLYSSSGSRVFSKSGTSYGTPDVVSTHLFRASCPGLPVAYNLARGRFDCVAAQKRGEPNRDQCAVLMPSTYAEPF
ncbi:hypothetical protein NUU61_004410 [Penicillium alfredii]|uniref:Peptidase S8/S53 domain-containing protein n=1 Tax=Penicillium alfredii TaxID=1506179 RepID=A0A9W9FL37_9EURO|nr:uncharacterized protein NUU61_004410 [Penicillium alfredii]KAJ5102188.1 hypothetical protein NUU61_004410 [Penicillium alfredii]